MTSTPALEPGRQADPGGGAVPVARAAVDGSDAVDVVATRRRRGGGQRGGTHAHAVVSPGTVGRHGADRRTAGADRRVRPQRGAFADKAIPTDRCSSPGTTPCAANSRRSPANGRLSGQHLLDGTNSPIDGLSEATRAFVADIDALVIAIEAHMSRWTTVLYLAQLSMLATRGTGGGAAGLYRLRGGARTGRRTQARRSKGSGRAISIPASNTSAATNSARWPMASTTWPTTCSRCTAISNTRSPTKTSELEDKRERLAGLYEVTSLVANTHGARRTGARLRQQHRAYRARRRRHPALVG